MNRAGLLVHVLRPARGGSSNNGVTERFDKFILVGDGIPDLFTPSADTPVLELVSRVIGGRAYLHAVPEEAPRGVVRGPMFGGCFIYTSDGRFPSDYPIPVHDRFEGGRS